MDLSESADGAHPAGASIQRSLRQQTERLYAAQELLADAEAKKAIKEREERAKAAAKASWVTLWSHCALPKHAWEISAFAPRKP